MPNRQQPQGQQQSGRRNPMQTSPDDDEAQLADQSGLESDDETERDEITDDLPTDRKRRPLQASQEREEERLARPEENEDEDLDDEEELDDEDDDEDDEEGLGQRE